MKTGKPSPHLATLIDLALQGDLGTGDVTADALFTSGSKARATFVAAASSTSRASAVSAPT